MVLISWLFSAAFAADGFYDTTSIAGASEVFTQANAMQSTYAEASSRSAAIADALREYQVALELLGDSAPAVQQAHLASLRAQFAREQVALQDFVGDLLDNFDQAFVDAMHRAIDAHEGDAVVCEARIAVGRQLPGMPARTEANPDCVGEDLNAHLATAMDADPLLAPRVAELMEAVWPQLTVPSEAQAATAGERAVPVYPFASQVMDRRLRTISRADDDARISIEAALEGSPNTSELARITELDAEIDTRIAGLYRDSFAGVHTAADKVLAKAHKNGAPSTGWCANPAFFGGCTVPMLDRAALSDLAGNRKVLKAAP